MKSIFQDGDRVVLKYWGGTTPRWLVGELGTITKARRTRAVVSFDIEKFSSTSRDVPMDFLSPAD